MSKAMICFTYKILICKVTIAVKNRMSGVKSTIFVSESNSNLESNSISKLHISKVLEWEYLVTFHLSWHKFTMWTQRMVQRRGPRWCTMMASYRSPSSCCSVSVLCRGLLSAWGCSTHQWGSPYHLTHNLDRTTAQHTLYPPYKHISTECQHALYCVQNP